MSLLGGGGVKLRLPEVRPVTEDIDYRFPKIKAPNSQVLVLQTKQQQQRHICRDLLCNCVNDKQKHTQLFFEEVHQGPQQTVSSRHFWTHARKLRNMVSDRPNFAVSQQTHVYQMFVHMAALRYCIAVLGSFQYPGSDGVALSTLSGLQIQPCWHEGR